MKKRGGVKSRPEEVHTTGDSTDNDDNDSPHLLCRQKTQEKV